jgi:hypothetical protein
MKGKELKLKLAATIFVGMMDRRNEPGYTDESALGESMRLAGLMVDIDTPKPDSELLELLKEASGMINHIGCINGECVDGRLLDRHGNIEPCQWCYEKDRITAAITKIEGD